jgi:hypothetical protein
MKGGTNFAARSGVEIRSRSTLRVIEKQCKGSGGDYQLQNEFGMANR